MWEEGNSQGVKVDDEAPSMFTPAAVKAADQRIAEAIEEYTKHATMGEEAVMSKAKAKSKRASFQPAVHKQYTTTVSA